MMTRTSLLIISLMLGGCLTSKKDKGELRYFRPTFKQYKPYINGDKLPDDPNTLSPTTVFNKDYPLEIVLYKDKKFFYNLPRLGEGTGEWSFDEGMLKLHTIHHIEWLNYDFDMDYEIVTLDETGKNLEIRFKDRNGQKNYPLEYRNVEPSEPYDP